MSPIEQMQAMMRWAQVDNRPTATRELTCFYFFLLCSLLFFAGVFMLPGMVSPFSFLLHPAPPRPEVLAAAAVPHSSSLPPTTAQAASISPPCSPARACDAHGGAAKDYLHPRRCGPRRLGHNRRFQWQRNPRWQSPFHHESVYMYRQ